MKKPCPHCYPFNANHLEYKIHSLLDFFVGTIFEIIYTIPLLRHFSRIIKSIIKRLILHFSIYIKHTTLTTDICRAKFDNCILVFWDEARKRGLPIFNVQIGTRQTQIFLIAYPEKIYFYDRNPIYLNFKPTRGFQEPAQYDNKMVFKKTLLTYNYPAPIGKAFISVKNAFEYGMQLGFPLVVKPLVASSSIHTFFNIQSSEELKKAIRLTKQISYQIIIERFIAGDVYRAVLINHTVIACAKREPASVIGDGKHTIGELINEKNKHPWRGAPKQLNSTLHIIEKNDALLQLLQNQQLTLKSILNKGKRLFLGNKIAVGNGADITNVTTDLHAENILLFEKLSRQLKLSILGLDFICHDIAAPWQTQSFAIIENNSLPGISIHHYPSAGEPINIAEKIWDFVIDQTAK